MLNKKEMSARLLELGLKLRYKPFWSGDKDDGSISLETRKFKIVDGTMQGSMIDIVHSNKVMVWTSQKKKAIDAARTNGFDIRLLDREAEMLIPFEKADKFLHSFGAKVRCVRVMTDEQREACRIRLAASRLKKYGPTA